MARKWQPASTSLRLEPTKVHRLREAPKAMDSPAETHLERVKVTGTKKFLEKNHPKQ
jgi:hypothetical protein